MENITITDEMKQSIKSYKNFLVYWENDLLPHAKTCIKDAMPIYKEMCEMHEKNLLSKEKQDILFEKAVSKGIHDFMAVHKIVTMCDRVQHNIKSMLNPSLCMVGVRTVFKDEGYYNIAFGEDAGCEEAVRYKLLAEKIDTALSYLVDVK